MKHSNQLAALGALLLAVCLGGYALYELVLYPGAGFPTSDFAVIVAGATTLRVGHWLKFGYALSIAMLVIGLYSRFGDRAPLLARLSVLAGSSAVVLFLASGHLGLHILAIAEATYATNPNEAITTILMRTVTIALFDAAAFAVGWYALLVNVAGLQTTCLPRTLSCVGVVLGILFILNMFLPETSALIAPLGSIVWAVWLAGTVWRENSKARVPVPA
jgi:hypothetical protein